MSEVRVRDLRAGYGTVEILHGISLTVPTGSTTAVLGDSGSGKTTLLRAIAGFIRPGDGEIQVGGRTMAGPRQWVSPQRRGVGYVRQEGGLFPHLSVAGNICFGLPRPMFGRRESAHHERILELLDLVELPAELAERNPAQLSGGQQQRVALARALAPEPSVVLLDEPFSSLDTALRTATREATARALHATGATVVLVTHDQGEALSFADEVAVLRSGEVRQVAPPRTIYGEPVDPHVAAFMGDAVMLEGMGVGPVVQVTAIVTNVRVFGDDAVVDLDLPGDEPDDAVSPSRSALRARVHGNETPQVGALVGLTVVGPARVFKR